MLREKNLHINLERWLDFYHGCAGLVVTGRIRDIGQNVLQSSFQTGSSSSSRRCFHIFLLIAFLEEASIRNSVIIQYNYNVNYNYGRLQDPILLFKIPKYTRKIFFEIYGQFGHAPSRKFASPGLASGEYFRGIVWLPAVITDLSLLQSIPTQPVGIHPPVSCIRCVK
jgi:hypothetical protein